MPVPAGFPPDVFDGDVIEAVHINRVRDSVYLWPGDVAGGGHSLTDVAGVVLRANGAINPLLVYNAAAALDWIIDTNGNLGSGTARNISGVGSVGFSDASVQTTAYKGVAANQTPWLQNIDAAVHSLNNVAAIRGMLVELKPAAGQYPLTIRNVGNTAWDWLIDTDGQILSQSNRSMSGINEIIARRVVIRPANSLDYPLAIATQANNASYDWLVDPSGHLSSQTGRSIATDGLITCGAITVGTPNVAYIGAAGNASFDAAYVAKGINMPSATGGLMIDGSFGFSGSFTTNDGRTVSVFRGVVIAVA